MDLIQEFCELVRLEVYSKQERKIADVLKQKLEELGLEVYEDNTGEKIGGNAGNVYGVLRGDADKTPILFSCHMDRVANNGRIEPIVDEEKQLIYTDKTTILAADDVAGIASVLYALRKIKEEKIPHGDIEIAFSVCEEQGVLGSRHFEFERFRSKIGYVLDSSGALGKIVNQAPGKCKLTLGAHGKSAHAGNEPEKGINALKVAADLLMHVQDSRISPYTTANYGVIKGGSSVNVVCDFVEIQGEARSTVAEELEHYLEELKAAVKTVSEKWNTTIDLKIEKMYDAFKIPEDHEVIRLASDAMKQVGLTPDIQRGGGGMDANHFNEHGIAAVGVAVGYAKIHTPDEEISIPALKKTAELTVQLIKEAAK